MMVNPKVLQPMVGDARAKQCSLAGHGFMLHPTWPLASQQAAWQSSVEAGRADVGIPGCEHAACQM